MAELKKIEIVCIPCHKCDVVKEKIQNILKSIENRLNVRIHCELISYTDRKEAMKEVIRSGYTITQLPVTRINGEVAFIGNTISEEAIRIILEGVLKY